MSRVAQAYNIFVGTISNIRIFLYSFLFPIGKNNVILGGFNLRGPTKLSIGGGCFININCFVQASGGVSIGNHVQIGPNVTIISEEHIFRDKSRLIKAQGHEYKPIVIEDDVWVGANAIILAGVTLHTGSVIRAGSVVTKDVDAYSIAVGAPAKIVGRRT